jgi:murein DD-endopeptidase MepM/ murein hydrolase activator NlpD
MRRPPPSALRRGLRVASLAGALGLVSSFAPGRPAGPAAAQAQTQEEIDEAAERERLRRVQEQAREKREQAETLKRKESRELNALRDLEKKERGTRTQISRLTRREKSLSHQLTGVQADLEEAEMSLEDRRVRLGTRLRAWYKLGRFRELEYLLSARSFTEFSVRMAYLSRLALSDRALLGEILREKERIMGTRDKLDRTIDQVQRTARSQKKEQVRLAELSQEKKELVAVIQNEREAYEAAAEELERTARRIRSLLDQLERQRLGEAPGALPPYEGDFGAGKGRLEWPVEGRVVGSFGNEKHPRWNTVTFNSGIDIAAPLGTDVRAVARGRVDFVSADYGSYGQMVILNHGEGYYTLYAHCSAILVSRGQEVNAGSVIARVGDTGSLKGSVLHFEIRKGRSAQNPAEWLR